MVYLYMSDQTSLILISEKQIACKLEGFFLIPGAARKFYELDNKKWSSLEVKWYTSSLFLKD